MLDTLQRTNQIPCPHELIFYREEKDRGKIQIYEVEIRAKENKAQ